MGPWLFAIQDLRYVHDHRHSYRTSGRFQEVWSTLCLLRIYALIVIGSGPAGGKAAVQAAYLGKRVAMIEKENVLGGATANTGTFPPKPLRETSLILSGFRQRNLKGIQVKVTGKIRV